MSQTSTASQNRPVRFVIVGVLAVAAFFGAYRFAEARNSGSLNAAQFAPAAAGIDAAATPGCACCGSTAPTENGITGEPAEGAATVAGDIQTIDVDLSQGYYQPNVILLTAGVPARITFGASSGCTAQVMSEELGFSEDLSAGPRTVELPALEPGEYPFYCGMRMVFGKIVVR